MKKESIKRIKKILTDYLSLKQCFFNEEYPVRYTSINSFKEESEIRTEVNMYLASKYRDILQRYQDFVNKILVEVEKENTND